MMKKDCHDHNYYFADQMVNELLAQAEATAKMFRRSHEDKPDRTTLARVHELAQAVVTATKSLNTIYQILKKEDEVRQDR